MDYADALVELRKLSNANEGASNKNIALAMAVQLIIELNLIPEDRMEELNVR